jgi:hypothetical protein
MTSDEIEKVHASLRFLDNQIGMLLELERHGLDYKESQEGILKRCQGCRFVINDLLEKVFSLENAIKVK